MRYRRRSLPAPALSGLALLLGLATGACRETPPSDRVAAADAASSTSGGSDTPPARAASTGDTAEAPLPVSPHPTPPPKLSDGWRSLDRDAVALALSRDGRWLVAGDLGGHVAFFDRTHPEGTRFVWGELARAGRIGGLACADDADICLASGFGGPDHSLRRYDLGALTASVPSPPLVAGLAEGGVQADTAALALSSDGVRQFAALAAPGETLGHALLLSSGPRFDILGRFDVAGPAGAFALSPDGGVAFRAVPGGGLVRHDFPNPGADGAPHATEGTRLPTRLALSHLSVRRNATGDLLVHGAEGTTLHVWALPLAGDAPGEPHARALDAARGPVSPIRGLHRVGDHTVAVTRPPEGGLVLWDADTGAELKRLLTDCPCERHALSADGTTAACRCATGAWVRHGPTGLALTAAPAVAPQLPGGTLPPGVAVPPAPPEPANQGGAAE
jgi:hypothetical protein